MINLIYSVGRSRFLLMFRISLKLLFLDIIILFEVVYRFIVWIVDLSRSNTSAQMRMLSPSNFSGPKNTMR